MKLRRRLREESELAERSLLDAAEADAVSGGIDRASSPTPTSGSPRAPMTAPKSPQEYIEGIKSSHGRAI